MQHLLTDANFPAFASHIHSLSLMFSLSLNLMFCKPRTQSCLNAFWKPLVASSGSYLADTSILSLMLLLTFRFASEGRSVST